MRLNESIANIYFHNFLLPSPMTGLSQLQTELTLAFSTPRHLLKRADYHEIDFGILLNPKFGLLFLLFPRSNPNLFRKVELLSQTQLNAPAGNSGRGVCLGCGQRRFFGCVLAPATAGKSAGLHVPRDYCAGGDD